MSLLIGFEGVEWWIDTKGETFKGTILLENEYTTTPPIKGFLRIRRADLTIEYINRKKIIRMWMS